MLERKRSGLLHETTEGPSTLFAVATFWHRQGEYCLVLITAYPRGGPFTHTNIMSLATSGVTDSPYPLGRDAHLVVSLRRYCLPQWGDRNSSSLSSL